MLVYVSGKYSGDVEANIAKARAVAVELWRNGYSVICPHLNTAHMEKDLSLTHDEWLAGDYEMIARCDAMVMLDEWKTSPGAVAEHAYASMRGIPAYEYPNLPPVSPTETRSPVQCTEFMDIIMNMYRMHLKKNADYSPANILATGEVGLVTRLWDKVARLMNLTGFRVDVRGCEFSAPKAPKNESVEDTLMDTAVYAVIGLLLRKGKWGI